MTENLYFFERKKEPAIAMVRLSSNFMEQTGRWVDSECILRRYDAQNPDIGLVEIPGEKLPARVHRQDFNIVS